MSVCSVKRENSDIHTVSKAWWVVSSCKIDLAFKISRSSVRVGHFWGVYRMWRQQEGKLEQVQNYKLSNHPDSFEYYHFYPHVSHPYHSKHRRIKQCISCFIFIQTELWNPSDHQACLSSSVIWCSAAFVCLTWGKSWTNAPCLSLRWHKSPEEQWSGNVKIQKLCFCV